MFVVRSGLSASEYKPLVVGGVRQHTDGTTRVRFVMAEPDLELGAVAAAHLMAKASIDGAEVAGRVAPVSPLSAKGYFELAAATAGESAMSKAIASLKTGDVVQFKGPVQGFQVGRNQFKSVGIIARGDGIADALQVATKLLSDPRDDTEIRLVYSVRSPDQLVLRNHIDALALLHPRFKALIVTDEAAPGWNGPTGPLTKPLLAAVLPPPTEGDSTVILVAGDVAAAAGKPTKTRASGVLGVMQYAPAQVRAL